MDQRQGLREQGLHPAQAPRREGRHAPPRQAGRQADQAHQGAGRLHRRARTRARSSRTTTATRREQALLPAHPAAGSVPPQRPGPGPGPPSARMASRTMADAALDVVAIGNAIVDVIDHADDAFLATPRPGQGRHGADRRGAGRGPLRRHGPGDRDVRRLGRQHRRRPGLASAPARLHRQGRATTSSARCSATTSAPPACTSTRPPASRTARHRALPDPGHARRAAHDEHLPRRLREPRPRRHRRGPDRLGARSPTSRAICSIRRRPRRPSARPPSAARGRAQGGAVTVRRLLRRAPPRRLPRR